MIFSVILLPVAAAPADQDLLHHAVMQTSVRQYIYREVDSTINDCYYCWLSDHEALFYRPAGIGLPDISPVKFTLVRYDFRTHKATPLNKLTKQFEATECLVPGLISPDGKWLLWEGGGFKFVEGTLTSEVNAIYIGAVDGSHLFRTPAVIKPVDPGYLFWMATSRNWIRMIDHRGVVTGAQVYRVNSPIPVQKLRFSRTNLFEKNNTDEGVVLSTNRMLIPIGPANRPSMSTSLLEADLTANGRITHRYILRFPHPADDLARAISTQGGRVAVLLASRQGDVERISLCVGKIADGTLHEVGYMDLNSPRGGQPVEPQLDSLKWLSDDQHVSFIYRGVLYVFSAS